MKFSKKYILPCLAFLMLASFSLIAQDRELKRGEPKNSVPKTKPKTRTLGPKVRPGTIQEVDRSRIQQVKTKGSERVDDKDKAADEKVKVFRINGTDVILKPSSKDVVSTRVFFKGGTANYDKKLEGIESLALHCVTEGGSEKFPKEAFVAAMEKMGSRIGTDSQYDYSSISATCLKDSYNETWDLLFNSVFEPGFSEATFEQAKQQALSAAQQASGDPDTHLRTIAMEHTFKGMDYAKIPEGSETSIANLDYATVQEYYKSLLKRGKFFIVVVGDLTEQEIREKLDNHLAGVSSPTKKEVRSRSMTISEPSLHMEERDLATNYIRGLMEAPAIGSPDEYPMRMAMQMMYDRMFLEVRTKRNLSYAPSAFFPSSIIKHPYLAIYVSTTEPNVAIQVMIDELKKVRNEGFTATELKNKKSKFLTQHYLRQETNDAQAQSLGIAYIAGDYSRPMKMLDKINDMTIEQINETYKKYAKTISFTYLGDVTKVDPDVFKQLAE